MDHVGLDHRVLVDELAWIAVVRIDSASKTAETFFSKAHHGEHGGSGGGHSGGGMESMDTGKHSTSNQHEGGGGKEESVTAGPRRLVDVVFPKDGSAMYIVDFGAMVIKEEPQPFRNTGVVWRVSPKGATLENQPPADLAIPESDPRRQMARG